ncbi:MAG: DUF3883 domain-containing protein [Bacilli bacterium]|nr:DUF3883 domain-containing protein [Bacilli bacterium]
MNNTNELTTFISRYQNFFKTKFQIIIRREKKNYELLEQFLDLFGPDKLPNLSLQDFCFAKGDRDTMCYWIDNTLNDLGDIHINGQCGFQKFGIQNIDGKYVFKRKNQKYCKYGENEIDVYKTINKEMQKVISAAKEHDIDKIDESILPQVFKAKLTYLYNKDEWMPIYVNTDVDILLKVFGLEFSNNDTLTTKRNKLYEFYLEVKKTIPCITTWEFMHFIYKPDGYREYLRGAKPVNSEIETNATQNKTIKSAAVIQQMDDADDLVIDDEELTKFIGTYTKNGTKDRKTTALTKKHNYPKKINHQKSQQKNERKGLIGEKLIVIDENNKLASLSLNLTADHNSLEDDTLGYDITSFDETGKKIYIEVKTTTTNRLDGFHLSSKEVEKAIEYEDNYRLYRVYALDVKNKTYKVEIFNGKELFEKFKLIETNYITELY